MALENLSQHAHQLLSSLTNVPPHSSIPQTERGSLNDAPSLKTSLSPYPQ